jgi:hypothetical protein
VIWSLCSMP